MSRTTRSIVAGHCYHVLNRGNARARVFHDSCDYSSFISLLIRAREHCQLSLLSMCLMPNHLHFVVRPHYDSSLAEWAHWLFSTHVRHHHVRHKTTGHIWQGRFKAFVIEQDQHLVTVMRYVERNPLRAGLVHRAEHWPWSSLRWRLTGGPPDLLCDSPVPLSANWIDFVNKPQTPAELAAIRACVNQGRAFGSEDWIKREWPDAESG